MSEEIKEEPTTEEVSEVIKVGNWDYYKVQFKLTTPMLGTATDVSIWQEHVIERAKKEIAKANKLGGKITKSLAKYKGSEIAPNKEIAELQGIMRSFLQLLGKPVEVPNTIVELLELNTTLKFDFDEEIKKRSEIKATVFIRNAESKPVISTHMILGNLKENLRITVNNGDKSILKYKLSVGEVLALDVKAVEDFMTPTKDIMRADSAEEFSDVQQPSKGRYILDSTGRILHERPISFDRMGKRETAIALSESLPVGTEFGATLRVRSGSPITESHLSTLFDLGKNNGFGSWRGSGNMGSYKFKIEKVDYVEPSEGGWK